MTIDPMAVWAGMTLRTWSGRYWMLAISGSDARNAVSIALESPDGYCSLIRDQAGTSLITDEISAQRIAAKLTVLERIGPFRIVSTDGNLPFNVVGFLRPALEVLNNAGIKAGPQCGVDHDHLFVYEDSLEDVHRLLADFITSAGNDREESPSIQVRTT